MDQSPPKDHSETQSVQLHLVTMADDNATPPAAHAAYRHAAAVRGISLTPDILFAIDSDELDAAALVKVERLAAFLQRYAARTASIEGYTDDAGAPIGNMALSLRRAESVQRCLVAHGIATNRLSSLGRGSTHPVASNGSETDRQQNRRVEVLICNGRD